MAGTLSKPNKSRERLLVRQIEGDAWEVWAMGDGGQARLAQACNSPGDAAVSSHSVLALPLRQLFALPLWLATTDSSLMREMIFLQLERRGLAGGRTAQEAVFDYRILKSTENKTLVLAIALPNSLPGALNLDLHHYEPSARTQTLPSDELVLWREGDRLALVVTLGTEVAYFEALGDDRITNDVLRELQCIKMQLEAENVIGRLNGVTLWSAFDPGEVSMIAGAMNLRITSADRPAPAIPAERMNLVPASVRESQKSAKAAGRKKSMMAVIAGIYVLLVLFLVLRVAWLHVQCGRVTAELKSQEPMVKQLEATAHRWDLLDAAINPESYPVELLLRCARLLPAEGVRFTLFKITGDRIFIQGEAKNAPAAFKFAEDLKQSKELHDYKWQMPQPRLLANDNAEFQIEGVRYGGNK